jgi:NADH-quinone oxidoreductase subunit I
MGIINIQESRSSGYILPVLRGLLTTMRHMLRRDFATIRYPEQRRAYSERFRGLHILTRREDGTPRCVACYMCQTICPAECITIVAEESPDPTIEKRAKSFEIDMLRCVYCGFCVDACPKEALIMSKRYELAALTREETVYRMDDLMERPDLATMALGYRPYFDPAESSGEGIYVGPGKFPAWNPVTCGIAGQKDPGV